MKQIATQAIGLKLSMAATTTTGRVKKTIAIKENTSARNFFLRLSNATSPEVASARKVTLEPDKCNGNGKNESELNIGETEKTYATDIAAKRLKLAKKRFT